MLKVALFVEDFGHEAFVGALVRRVAEDYKLSVDVIPRSVRGGHGKAISELKEFVRDLRNHTDVIPDLIVVAIDANCKGHGKVRHDIESALAEYGPWAAYAVPDPHVERWMLLDSSAFQQVFGKGCAAPDQKCNRDRYKELLANAIRAAGIEPPLGGIEYAEEVVTFIDLTRVRQMDEPFNRLLGDLEDQFAKHR